MACRAVDFGLPLPSITLLQFGTQGRNGVVKLPELVAGGSFMRFRKDLALGGNLGAQWYATPETTVASKATLNNKGAGGLTLRVTSHDVPALGLSLLVPVLGSIIARIRGTDDGLA